MLYTVTNNIINYLIQSVKTAKYDSYLFGNMGGGNKLYPHQFKYICKICLHIAISLNEDNTIVNIFFFLLVEQTII